MELAGCTVNLWNLSKEEVSNNYSLFILIYCLFFVERRKIEKDVQFEGRFNYRGT